MYGHNYGNAGGHSTRVAYAPATGYTVNPAFVPPPGFITATPAAAATAATSMMPAPIMTPNHTPPPPSRALTPVQVPPGYHPVELVQFWRGQTNPLHWAFFVRTAAPQTTSRRSGAQQQQQQPHGNFYELVGLPDMYTAQFLTGVTFSPETLPDWRGTHVIGWVHPAQLGAFEWAVRQVPVWRRRPEWRCQDWVWEVVCALRGVGRSREEGVFVEEGCTLAGLQRQMAKLLDAWENGDI